MSAVPSVGEGSAAGEFSSTGKKRGVARKGGAETANMALGGDAVDQGVSVPSSSRGGFAAGSAAERPRKVARRGEQAKRVESHRDHVFDDENEFSPAKVDALRGDVVERSTAKLASIADDVSTATTAAAAASGARIAKSKKANTAAAASETKGTEATSTGTAESGADSDRDGGQAVALARPRRAVSRPSYAEYDETDENPSFVRRESAGRAKRKLQSEQEAAAKAARKGSGASEAGNTGEGVSAGDGEAGRKVAARRTSLSRGAKANNRSAAEVRERETFFRCCCVVCFVSVVFCRKLFFVCVF